MPQTIKKVIITHSCNYIIVIYLVVNHKTVTVGVKHSKLKIRECSNVKKSHSFIP